MTTPQQSSPSPSPSAGLWSPDDADRVTESRRPDLTARLAQLRERTRLRVHAQWVLLGVGLVFMLWRGLMIHSAGDFLPQMAAVWWVLTWVGLLGLVTGRTLPLRRLFAYVLFGFFAVAPLTVLLVGPVLHVVPYELGVAFVVPVAEEVLKAAPLLLLALAARRDPYGPRSVLDYGLAGFAIGGGFWIHEDILWERTTLAIDGLIALPAPWLYVDGPNLTGSHPGWTALIGLGIGVMVVFRGRRLTWVVALVAVLAAVLEHAGWNFSGGVDLLAWSGHGRVPLVMLLLGTLFAMAHGVYVQRWAAGRDDLLPTVTLRTAPWRRQWRRAAEFTLVRNQAYLAAWQRESLGATQPPRLAAPALLVHLGESAQASPSEPAPDQAQEP